MEDEQIKETTELAESECVRKFYKGRIMEYQRRNGYVLVLRTCTADMMSYGGFVWPESGFVEAPDWEPIQVCGNGLHGLLWGEGDGELLHWGDDAKWLVCEVAEDQIVDLVEKVKFPKAEVIYCGDRKTATDLIYRVRPGEVVGAIGTAGDGGTATAGYRGTAIAGDGGTAIAGENGTATAGNRGTAIAGYCGRAIAGDGGKAIVGRFGTVSAGIAGSIQIQSKTQIVIGYIGEDGLLPNTPYKLDAAGRFAEAE